VKDLSGIASGIRLSEEGIWFAETASSVSYPATSNDFCYQVEENSFWFNHRNRCLADVIKRFPPGGPVFDIGGGNGYVSLAIQNAGFEAVVVEPGVAGARNARRRGIETVICSTLENAGFRDRSMAAAGLFDVIEHIEDDVVFLQSLARRIAVGGRLYLTTPAFSALWSQEDHDAGHYRRYALSQLRRALEQAGFEIDYLTYFFGILPLPALVLRVLPYRLGIRRLPAETEHRAPGGLPGRFLNAFLDRELTRLRAGRSIGFGGSCLAVAHVR
jgi:SAM-dependent methyltransferase